MSVRVPVLDSSHGKILNWGFSRSGSSYVSMYYPGGIIICLSSQYYGAATFGLSLLRIGYKWVVLSVASCSGH